MDDIVSENIVETEEDLLLHDDDYDSVLDKEESDEELEQPRRMLLSNVEEEEKNGLGSSSRFADVYRVEVKEEIEPNVRMGPDGDGPQRPVVQSPPPQPMTNLNTSTATTTTTTSSTNVANTREKTPMCPVNELARFNKVLLFYYMSDQNGRNLSSRGPPQPGFRPAFSVSLRVGSREFLGEGPTARAARHHAASRALRQLRSLPLLEETLCCDSGLEIDPNADLKSPISLDHERALKRNLPENFEVESEEGPPRKRTLVSKCSLGDKLTNGEGNGKKKRAAEKTLEERKKLPPTSPTSTSRLAGKKKTRNLIKEQKAEPEYREDIIQEDIIQMRENPITRLNHIQQAKKEQGPTYSWLGEKGEHWRREFVMEVTVGPFSFAGSGSSKKLAKRAAAEGLLQKLGYSRPSVQPTKPSIKTEETPGLDKKRKVTFSEDEKPLVDRMQTGGSSGRQSVPGLLPMSEGATTNGYGQTTPTGAGSTTDASHDQAAPAALRAPMGLDSVAPQKESGSEDDG